MRQSKLSMIVFCIYISIFGLVFMFVPNPVITLLGFDAVTDVWIRIVGLLLIILGFYFFMAIREEAYNFFRWTVYGRLPMFFVFLAFVIFDLGPPILLLFGAFDTSCAIWTGMALNKERKDKAPQIHLEGLAKKHEI